MRSKGIEVEIDIDLIPQELIDSDVLDIEYFPKGMSNQVLEDGEERKGANILWIHDDEFKSFKQEYFQYLGAGISVFNRKTKTNHLDIFLETTDDVEEDGSIYIRGVDEKLYKNVRFSELGEVDLSKIKFKRDLNPVQKKEIIADPRINDDD